MEVEMKNIKGEYKETTFLPNQDSLFEDHEDGFGQNIYIENVLRIQTILFLMLKVHWNSPTLTLLWMIPLCNPLVEQEVV